MLKNIIFSYQNESIKRGIKHAWGRIPSESLPETERKGKLRKCLKPSGYMEEEEEEEDQEGEKAKEEMLN